ncbi:MAG: hypothetical protein ACKO3K_17190 [Cuspidothrix sp.]
MKCNYCGGEYRLFCVSHQRTGRKTLHRGCCGGYVRECPDPSLLLEAAGIGEGDRIFLERLKKITWYDQYQVAQILEIEKNLNNFAGECA